MGPRPMPSKATGALKEFLKCDDPYIMERASPCVPYSASKVRVVREGILPKPLRDLVGPMGAEILLDLKKNVLKNNRELLDVEDDELGEPYFDPRLRDRQSRLDLGRRLLACGLATGRR